MATAVQHAVGYTGTRARVFKVGADLHQPFLLPLSGHNDMALLCTYGTQEVCVQPAQRHIDTCNSSYEEEVAGAAELTVITPHLALLSPSGSRQ